MRSILIALAACLSMLVCFALGYMLAVSRQPATAPPARESPVAETVDRARPLPGVDASATSEGPPRAVPKLALPPVVSVAPPRLAFQTVTIRSLWRGAGDAASATTVTVRRTDDATSTETVVGRANADGLTTVALPVSWRQARIRVNHRHAPDESIRVDLPVEDTVLVELSKGSTLRGMVWSEDGRPVDGARVRLLNDEADETLSDSVGVYRLEGIAAGEFRIVATLGASRSDRNAGDSQTVDARPGGRYVRDLHLRPGLTLSGAVATRGTDAPIVGAAVTARAPGESWSALTGDDGGFRFEGLPSGDLALTASADDHVSSDVIVRMADATDSRLNLALAPRAQESHRLVGRVLDMGVPVERAYVLLSPRFPWARPAFTARTDAFGYFAIDGLRTGDYDARLSQTASPSVASRTMNATLHVAGDTEREFRFRQRNTVTARLAFDRSVSDEQRARFVSASIQLAGRDGAATRDDSIAPTPHATNPIEDGRIAFRGRFRGPYVLSLRYEISDDRSSTIAADKTVDLDNFDADQDLGVIAAPAFGWIRVLTAFAPDDAPRPERLSAIVRSPGGHRRMSTLGIDASETDRIVGPVPAGTYEVTLSAPAHRCLPKWTTVEVAAGHSPILAAFLLPDGVLAGRCAPQGGGGVDRLRLTRVTLTDEATSRSLTPDIGASDASRFEGEDFIHQNQFRFRGLESGTYRIAIEADGYRVYRDTLTITAGQGGAPRTFVLRPLQ